MRLHNNSKPYKIIKTLALSGGVILLSTIAPLGGAQVVKALVKEYFRKKRFEREKFLRDLKRLQVRKLVDYKELNNGEIKIVLTKNGEKEVLLYDLDNLKLNSQKKWDGKWRLVIFDIPHFKKKAREVLRAKLKLLGFYPIQKSVFLTPHECEKEIDFICSVFDIRDHVLILYVNGFEGESKFRHHFKV